MAKSKTAFMVGQKVKRIGADPFSPSASFGVLALIDTDTSIVKVARVHDETGAPLNEVLWSGTTAEYVDQWELD